MSLTSYKKTISCCYIGYITQGIVNIFAPLLFVTFSKEFGISISQITILTTLNFFTQLLVDLMSTRFVDIIGYRTSIVAAHAFCAVGLISMAVLPGAMPIDYEYAGLLLSVILYAIGGGLIEVLISPMVEACPSDDKEAAMSILHSFYCWGSVGVILISTLFFAVFGSENWRIMTVIWAIVPSVNALCFTRVPINELVSEGEGMSIKQLFGQRMFWALLVLMLCAGASELAMSQWASAFAESGLRVSKTIGDIAGPCMFSILMGLARVFYGKFSSKIVLSRFIILSSILCAVSYIIAALSPSPILSLTGCALCGLSVGILWPGVYSIAAKKLPRGGTAMFALLALAGDMGCTSGPTIVGIVSGAFSDNLSIGFVAASVFPIIMIFGMRALSKSNIGDIDGI